MTTRRKFDKRTPTHFPGLYVAYFLVSQDESGSTVEVFGYKQKKRCLLLGILSSAKSTFFPAFRFRLEMHVRRDNR